MMSDLSEEADLEIHHIDNRESLMTQTSFRRKLVTLMQTICRVEIVAFIQAFSYGIHGVIRTNLIIEKMCRVDLNISESICQDIDHHKSESNLVQENVTDLNLYLTFLCSVPTIIISMMVGPLSDKYGRRPLMLIPIIGHILAQVAYLLNVYFWDASANYILFVAVYVLFGGNTTFLIGLYTYIIDISTPESRTARVSVLDVALIAGGTSGNFLSAIVYEKLGFNGTFGITIGLLAINFFFILFCLKESRKPVENDLGNEPVASDGVMKKTSETFVAVFGAKTGYTRSITIILMFCMLNYVAAGSTDINYLFTRKMFDWNESQFTKVSTGSTVLQSLCSLFVLPLLSYKLGVSDQIIGLIASLSSLTSILGFAFSKTESFYIAANVASLLSPQVSTVVRSLLSKTVEEADLGKVYTMLGCLENFIPLVASPFLTFIYNSTLDTFPGAVYIAESGFMFTNLILFSVICILWRLNNQSRYSFLVTEF